MPKADHRVGFISAAPHPWAVTIAEFILPLQVMRPTLSSWMDAIDAPTKRALRLTLEENNNIATDL